MRPHRAQAILLCLGLFTACGGGSLAPGVGNPSRSLSLHSIQIVPSQPSIYLGQNQQFSAIGVYSDGSTKDITASVVWGSSNSSVATISGPGFAKSRAIGSVTISAASSGVTGYGTLTVTNAILVSIAITPANAVLLLGTLQQFKATGTFSDQSTQDITSSVTWASSNSSFASIKKGGLATARALGSLTISATSGSVSGSTPATVQLAVLSLITIKPKIGRIAKLTEQQFHAIGTYTDGSTHNVTGKVSWTSSDTTVAKISIHGLAHGLAAGTTTITATLDSLSASATLEVTDATVVSISLKPAGRTIPVATRLSFTATGLFSDNTTQVISGDSRWASDNRAVAISRGSTATAVGPGTANISATFEGVSGSAKLNVSSATLISISVTPATAVLAPATSVGCAATGTYSDGSTQVITGIVSWTSSDSTVASVSNGNVTAQSGGSAIITAQFGSLSGESTITVDASPLTSIQISPPAATVAQQKGVGFLATGTFADGNTQDLTPWALWTSSLPSVATIDTGQATGLEPGTVTITALFTGQVGTASLTVTSGTSAALVVSPAASNFEPGGFTELHDLGAFSGTTKEVMPRVISTSSSANVAAVTSFGLATRTADGTITVTATTNARNGTSVLRVH